MKSFEFGPVTVLVFLTLVFMAGFALLFLAPIACIQLAWNAAAGWSGLIPAINAWQALLLYIATALVLYLVGLVKIDVKVERL